MTRCEILIFWCKEDVLFWLEIIKAIASATTPVLVAAFGYLLLRRVESIKAEVVKQSEFDKKWAEQFFGCCQDLMNTLEKYLSNVNFMQFLKTPDQSDFAKELENEILHLHNELLILELRIKRGVVFAPKKGSSVSEAATNCIKLTSQLINSKQGSFDPIIKEMNNFNIAAREAHAEMLRLKSKPGRLG